MDDRRRVPNRSTGPGRIQRKKRDKFAWTLLAIVVLLVAAMALPTFRYFQGPAPAPEIRFTVQVSIMPNPYHLSISPDGRSIAYVATSAKGLNLFVRPMDSITAQQLPGTDDAQHPFWSPDGRSVAFFAGGKLKRIEVGGGLPQTICDAARVLGGTWGPGGTIVFASNNVLHSVSSGGGLPSPITSLNHTQSEIAHAWPYFLPDGRHYLYLAWSGETTNRAIYVGHVDSSERTRLISAESMPAYANPGYLIFQRRGTVFAQSFDPATFELQGEPVRIADEVANNTGNGRAAFAVAHDGVLIYRASGAGTNSRFTWFDRNGKQSGAVGEAGPYVNSFDLSPDGKQIVAGRSDSGNTDIWTIDLARNVPTRLTFDQAPEGDPVWSPDGAQFVFTTQRNGSADVAQKNASGLGDEIVVLGTPLPEWSEDWSQDGRYLAFQYGPPPTDIYAVPLFGDRKPFPVVRSPFNKDEPHFSYDGKWLAYGSAESGTWQVYVVSFPATDLKSQISINGGSQPRWRKDGKELYYLSTDGKIMAVDMNLGAKIHSGIPRELFDTELDLDPIRDQYDVTSDGQRFLLLKPVAGGTTATPITVVLNWTNALTKN